MIRPKLRDSRPRRTGRRIGFFVRATREGEDWRRPESRATFVPARSAIVGAEDDSIGGREASAIGSRAGLVEVEAQQAPADRTDFLPALAGVDRPGMPRRPPTSINCG